MSRLLGLLLQLPRPLDNDLIWGNYEVSYVSSGSSQRGQRAAPPLLPLQSFGCPFDPRLTAHLSPAAAGGRFRGSIGRAIFQTRGVYQSVLQPDLVTNKVPP